MEKLKNYWYSTRLHRWLHRSYIEALEYAYSIMDADQRQLMRDRFGAK